MPYLGRDLDKGNYLKLDDISSSFNGSTTTFDLKAGGSDFYPGSAYAILVSLGGIIQEPEGAYTINKNQITFASAPVSGDTFFCTVLGTSVGVSVPGHGTVNGAQLASPFNYDAGLLYLDSTNDKVGIASESPTVELDVKGRVKGDYLTAIAATFTGNVSIAGTLTYQDVEYVDSVGIITAQTDIHVGEDISHLGDLHTKIRFAADTIALETAGQMNVQVGETLTTLKSKSGTDTKLRFQHQGNSGYGDITVDRQVNAFIIDNDPTNAGNNATYFSVKNKGKENLRIAHDGKIGINTTTLTEQLEVDGDIRVRNAIKFREDNGAETGNISLSNDDNLTIQSFGTSGHITFDTGSSAEERLRITSNGIVNIGDTTNNEYLGSTLKVRKDQNSVTRVTIRNENQGSGSAAAFQMGAYGNSWMLQCGSAANDSNAFTIRVDGTANSNTGTEKFRITTDGKVGIGEDSPDTNLHVKGTGTDILKIESTDTGAQGTNLILQHSPGAGNMADNDVISLIQFNGKDDSNNNTTYSSIRAVATDVSNNSEKGDLTFFTRNGSDFLERLRIKSDGNIIPGTNNATSIGDGTTNFNSIWASTRFRGNDNVKLILGNSQNLVIRHDGSNNIIGSPVADDLHIKSGTLDNDSQLIAAFKHSNASVGVGTHNPLSKLHLADTNTTVWPFASAVTDTYGYTPYPHELIIDNDARGTEGSFAGIYFNAGADTDGSKVSTARIAAIDTGNYKADLAFATRGYASGGGGADDHKEHLRITSAGKVGIATVNPQQMLDVRGNVVIGIDQVSGNPGNTIGIATIRGHHVNSAGDFARLYFSNSLSASGAATRSSASIRGMRLGDNLGTGLGFWTNPTTGANPGVERLRIDHEGIIWANYGNSLSSSLMILDKDGSGEAQLRFYNAGSNKAQIALDSSEELTFDVNGGERLRIDSGGNIGIGTNDPDSASNIHITDTIGQIRVETTDTNNYGLIRFAEGGYSGTRDKYLIAYNNGHSAQANQFSIKNQVGDITFMAGGVNHTDEKVRITSAGNVGIGLTNPSQIFEVQGGSAAKPTFRHSASWGALRVAGSAGGSGAGFIFANNYNATIEEKWSIYLDGSNDGLRFTAGPPETTSAEKVRITSAGIVGVGVNDPAVAGGYHGMEIGGSANTGLRLSCTASSGWAFTDYELDGTQKFIVGMKGSTNADVCSWRIATGASLDSNVKLVVTENGKIGINESDPYYMLDIKIGDSTTALSGGNAGDWGGNGIRLSNVSQTVGSMSLFHFRTHDADWHVGNKYVSANKSDFIFLHEGTNEKLRITSTGAVTISGNNSAIAPTSYNDLTGTDQAGLLIGSSSLTDSGIVLRTGTSGTGRIYFGDNSGSDAGRKQGQINYYHNGDFMIFATANTERLRIDDGGTIRLKRTDITSTATTANNDGLYLDIGDTEGSASYNQLIGFGYRSAVTNCKPAYIGYQGQTWSGHTYGDLIFGTRPNTTGTDEATERIRIKYNGRIGLNNNDPQARFHSGNTGLPTGGMSYSSGTTGTSLEAIIGSSANAGSGSRDVAFALIQQASSLSSIISFHSGVSGGTNPYFKLKGRQQNSPHNQTERYSFDAGAHYFRADTSYTTANLVNIRGTGSTVPYARLTFSNADSNNHANAYRIDFWEGDYQVNNNANGWIEYDAGTGYGGDGSIKIGGYIGNDANLPIAVFNRERNTVLLGNRMSVKSSTNWTGSQYPGHTTSTSHTGAVFKFDSETDGNCGLAVGSLKEPFVANRIGSDGYVVRIRQDGNTEGQISVSGSTVTYAQFMGAHKARLSDDSKPDILVGTVMETVDKLITWKYASFSVGVGTDATTKYIPYYGTKNDGETDTITFDSNTYTAAIKNHRETLPETNKRVCVNVSNTVGSKSVFGVFHEWDNDTALERESTNLEYSWNDMNIAALGNYFIRMQEGQTPEIGDYVESAGDGTAKVQSDDILRSKTIAKITSTVKQKTYSDNSFLVTCTLHCG